MVAELVIWLSSFFIIIALSVVVVFQYQQGQHLIDVTEAFNHLNREKRRRVIKLVSSVAILFLSLFWMLYSIIEDADL